MTIRRNLIDLNSVFAPSLLAIPEPVGVHSLDEARTSHGMGHGRECFLEQELQTNLKISRIGGGFLGYLSEGACCRI